MAKAYVSNRFPYLGIGNDIRFQRGLYVAKNEREEEQIEKHEWFGTHIFARDVVDEKDAPERRVVETSQENAADEAEFRPSRKFVEIPKVEPLRVEEDGQVVTKNESGERVIVQPVSVPSPAAPPTQRASETEIDTSPRISDDVRVPGRVEGMGFDTDEEFPQQAHKIRDARTEGKTVEGVAKGDPAALIEEQTIARDIMAGRLDAESDEARKRREAVSGSPAAIEAARRSEAEGDAGVVPGADVPVVHDVIASKDGKSSAPAGDEAKAQDAPKSKSVSGGREAKTVEIKRASKSKRSKK
jgi:hypothetical protein